MKSYCQKDNDRYNCQECAFVNYGRDCHNNPITLADGPCDSCGADAADCRCGDYVDSGPMPEWMKAKFDEMPNPAASDDDEPFFQ